MDAMTVSMIAVGCLILGACIGCGIGVVLAAGASEDRGAIAYEAGHRVGYRKGATDWAALDELDTRPMQ